MRVAAAQALGPPWRSHYGPALVPLLGDPDPAVVAAAVAAAIGRIGDAGTAVSLAETLYNVDQPLLVRRSCGSPPSPTFRIRKSQPTLFDALNDPDAQVRGYAAQALGQVGNEAAWTALGALQKDNSRLLEEGTVRGCSRAGL